MNITQGALAIGISFMVLLGSGAGVYANLKADIQTHQQAISKLEADVGKLDSYDIYLQDSINMNRESNIRLGTLMEGNEKNTQRLTAAIDKLFEKIDTLTKVLYTLDKT